MKKISILLVAISLVLFAACNGRVDNETNPEITSVEDIPSSTEATVSVVISEFEFIPDELTINAGENVTWKHDDKVTHTIIFQGFESGNMKRGDTFTHTFDSPGTYEYYCSIHPAMRGVITVK